MKLGILATLAAGIALFAFAATASAELGEDVDPYPANSQEVCEGPENSPNDYDGTWSQDTNTNPDTNTCVVEDSETEEGVQTMEAGVTPGFTADIEVVSVETFIKAGGDLDYELTSSSTVIACYNPAGKVVPAKIPPCQP